MSDWKLIMIINRISFSSPCSVCEGTVNCWNIIDITGDFFLTGVGGLGTWKVQGSMCTAGELVSDKDKLIKTIGQKYKFSVMEVLSPRDPSLKEKLEEGLQLFLKQIEIPIQPSIIFKFKKQK